jgi:hypothetical protein
MLLSALTRIAPHSGARFETSFSRKGGGVERTPNFLQNRFNEILSYKTRKFVGFLRASLREYRSGWNMHDYVTEAKVSESNEKDVKT